MIQLRVGAVASVLLVALPWLNPIASGPSPNVVPQLVAWLCAAVLLATRSEWSPVARNASLALAIGAAIAHWKGASMAAAWMAPCAAVFCLLAAQGRRADGEGAQIVALGWALAATLSCVAALFQYFGFGAALAPLISAAEPGEAYASLRQRNQFATLTSLGLVSVLWLRPKLRPGVLAVLILLLAIGNAASASRTGALQWLCVATLAVWPAPGRADGQWRWALMALVAYVLASMTLPHVFEAVMGYPVPNVFSRIAQSSSCGSRIILWSNVLELSRERPWLGWGWGELDYAHYAHLYSSERFCDLLDNAHSLPLHLAVELGWPAALVLCGGGTWFFAKRLSRTADPAVRLGWGALLAILLHSLVEYPLWYGPFQMAAGFASGLVLAGRRPAAAGYRLIERGVLVCLAAVAFAWAIWDYHRVSQLYLLPEDRAESYRTNTLAKAQRSRLFRDQVRFAELSITPLTRENAAHMHQLALDMLHFSPEPKVISVVIDSALLLGRDDVALWHMARFKAAFAEEYSQWAADRGGLPRAP